MILLSIKSRQRFISLVLVGISLFVSPLAGITPAANALQYDEYLQRKSNLIALSGVFGALHHIRRTCNPRQESTIWRERMGTMIELEEPDSDTHLEMVNAFNDRFRETRTEFSTCTPQAQERGKDLSFEGAALVQALETPLLGDVPISQDQ